MSKVQAFSVVEVYRRLDETIDASSSGSKDCKAGCSYCCHIRVVAQPHEVFHIVDYMQAHFRPERIRHVLDRARTNRKRIDSLTYEQHVATNIECPLLNDGQCSVYPARPAKCRAYHSQDVRVCVTAHHDTSYSEPHPYDQPVIINATLYQQALTQDIAQQGFDTGHYEFNGALIDAFTKADSRKRWKNGKHAFAAKFLTAE